MDVPDPLFVSIHVRRGDYVTILTDKNGTIANRDYFTYALQQLKLKLPLKDRNRNIIAIVISNDYEWTELNLSNLNGTFKTISAKNVSKYLDSNKEDDLKLLDLTLTWSSDHAIYDYGSYGLWGALFAGGDDRIIIAGVEYDPFEAKLPCVIGITHANMQNLYLVR